MSDWLNAYFPIPRFSSKKLTNSAWNKLSEWQNEQQHREMFMFLTNLWLNLFKWNGLPDTCNEKALERTLFFDGKALFFRDDEPYDKNKYPVSLDAGEPKYFHTPCNLGVGLNLYYQNVVRTAYSYDYNKDFDITNSVLIQNNRLMFPSYETVMIWTEKLVNAARTIDVLAENMKTPYIIVADETERMTAEAYLRSKRLNQDAILFTRQMGTNAVTVFPTATQNTTISQGWDHKHSLENEIFTRMGINNANTDKKERLITSEVEANDGLIAAAIGTQLDARKEACEEINKMFGLNVSVELKNQRQEVETDGESYDNTSKLSGDIRRE